MDSIGIRDLRQNASVHLRRVQAGETLCITDRGEPVAVLLSTGDVLREGVRELIMGLVSAGAYADLDAALAAGVEDLVRRARSRLVDEAIVRGYALHPQEPDPWVEDASSRVVADLDPW